MTFLSRVAGLVRDLVQASLVGAGPAVSAFVVAYRIPNYLRRVFAGHSPDELETLDALLDRLRPVP